MLGRSSFGARTCPGVSTGRGIAALEVAGTRVLWLAYAGGNTREWTLETGSRSQPEPRQLRFVAQDVEQSAPIVLGPADGSLLAYASGTSVVALRPNGSRAFAWTAPATVTSLAVAGGRVAVGQASGDVAIVSGGRLLGRESVGAPVDAVAFSRSELVVQLGRSLQLGGGPGPHNTVVLPKGARLEDADARRAVYVAAGEAHLVTLASGADTVAGPAEHAALDGHRLVLVNDGSVVSRTL
jgi:hypothetical protein